MVINDPNHSDRSSSAWILIGSLTDSKSLRIWIFDEIGVLLGILFHIVEFTCFAVVEVGPFLGTQQTALATGEGGFTDFEGGIIKHGRNVLALNVAGDFQAAQF